MVVILLPSCPLYILEISHISTVDVEQRNFIGDPVVIVVVSPFNPLDEIDTENIRLSVEKRIHVAFSK